MWLISKKPEPEPVPEVPVPAPAPVAPVAVAVAVPAAEPVPAAPASPYAAFSALPAVAGQGLAGVTGTLTSVAADGLPMHLRASAKPGKEAEPAAVIRLQAAAFSAAREKLAEQERWQVSFEVAAQERRERMELMKVACVGGGAAQGAGTTAPNRAAALQQVEAATGLSMERCKFYLEQNDYDVTKTLQNISEVGAISTAGSTSEVTLDYHVPGKGAAPQKFRLDASGFDLYQKAFELLTDNSREFKMTLTGPALMKALDEDTWSSSLTDLGILPGKQYKIAVAYS